jgi:TolB-like protein/class 3 adenylate cyclase/Flp pilus assembly protein TadD
MSAEIKKEIQLEIAHVLFIDIVGYSKLSINEQRAAIDELNEAVRGSEQFQKAEAAARFIKIPTGDGMALVFYKSPEEPVECALEISRALKEHRQLRMGAHSGPVSGVIDVNGQANLAGAGLNMAQRVMDCGDAGHILLSKRVADDLGEYEHWRPLLHDLGECEVKHGMRLSIVNLHADEVGNPQLPKKFEALKKHRARMRWTVTTAALLAFAAIVAGIAMFSRNRVPPTLSVPEKSIAVLPFGNLSRDPDNAYFAEGIQDEILTRLAKIGALKVISHTSTQQYSARPGNLHEIARQLGVANVLEGSVQKVGVQVHINVQLIHAATDEHLWAESYDRKLDDIFGVEGEVATNVAEALKAKLTGIEQHAIQEKPTTNSAAYDAYLRALASSVLSWTPANNLQAIKYFGEAVKLDPKFALAWARLGHMNALGYFNEITDNPVTLREDARHAVATAIDLQANLGEACLAQGFFEYYCERDYDRAIASFEKAWQLSPNNSQIPRALALVCRRKGEWERCLNYFRKALELNPRDVELLDSQSEALFDLRQYEAALSVCDRILAIAPGDVGALVNKADVYQARGDLPAAAAILTPLRLDTNSPFFNSQIGQWIYERRYGDAILALKSKAANPDHAESPQGKIYKKARLAWLQQLSGDNSSAHTTWEQVRSEFQGLFGGESERSNGILVLAWANAALGDKKTALAIAQRTANLDSVKKDAVAAAWAQQWSAKIAMQMGEPDRVLSILERSAEVPAGIDYGDLKLSPMWDPLRGNPRFEKIVQSLKPKETVLAK